MEQYKHKGTCLGIVKEILARVLWKGTLWVCQHCVSPFPKVRVCGEGGMKARQLWVLRLWGPADANVKVEWTRDGRIESER